MLWAGQWAESVPQQAVSAPWVRPDGFTDQALSLTARHLVAALLRVWKSSYKVGGDQVASPFFLLPFKWRSRVPHERFLIAPKKELPSGF